MLDISTVIFSALRTLCNTILIQGEEGSPTDVILGFANAKAKLPYLCISRPSYRQIGSTAGCAVVEHGVAPFTYTKDRIATYQATMVMTEVGGNGNMISTVISRLGDPVIRDLMSTLKLSILSIGTPTSLPQVQGSGFIDEFFTDLTVAFAVTHTNTTEIITAVEIIPNLVHNL